MADACMLLGPQAALREPERANVLLKARRLVDGLAAVIQSRAATRATTPEEAHCARVEVAPPYLLGRVERGQELPAVEVMGEEERKGGHPLSTEGEEGGPRDGGRLSGVVRHVVWEMKAELVVELMGMIRPRWSLLVVD